MAAETKRRKIEKTDISFTKEPESNLSIFIIPVRFTKARLNLLKDLCKSKGLSVVEKFR